LEEEIIDKNRVAEMATKIKCAVKQVAGKAVDDAKLELDGRAIKIGSKVSVIPCGLGPHAWPAGVCSFAQTRCAT
jgi:uncharacterized protein YjbJ (UPF0337 family)